MKIIIGLGNPGKAYEKTYHNIGFMVLDEYCKKHGAVFSKQKYNALICELRIGNENVLCVKPQTFMNNSGESVVKIINLLKVDLKNVLVVYDDIDIEMGEIRLRESGSAGSHNGMKSIIENLNSNQFSRLRVGIKAPYYNLADYVLSKIHNDNLNKISLGLQKSLRAIDLFVSTDGNVKEINDKNLLNMGDFNKAL